MKKQPQQESETQKDRLLAIERKLKTKFGSNYNSVRKAFLDLDTDYDGVITEYDLANFLQGDGTDVNDLKKLMLL